METPMMCKECGGACCKNYTSFTRDEWEVLHKYADPQRIVFSRPTVIMTGRDDGFWITQEKGCPALTETGCVIPHDERPLNCRLYPFVRIKAYGENRQVVDELLLATKTCPFWRELGAKRDEAMEELNHAAQEGK